MADFPKIPVLCTWRERPIEHAIDFDIDMKVKDGPFVVYDAKTHEAVSRHGIDYSSAVMHARNLAGWGQAVYLVDHGDDRPEECEFYEPILHE